MKNSDDLILFGDDLIKDVLSDMSQVKVLIETYKTKPKFFQFYEEFCTSQQKKFFPLIIEKLKKSEESACLILNNLVLDKNQIPVQFELLFEAMIVNFRQLLPQENIFIKKLVHLDLSCNYLSDIMMNSFFEKIFFSLDNLKHLNLSNNNLTIKTLKQISEMSMGSNFGMERKLNVYNFIFSFLKFFHFKFLETINISGNDFSPHLICGLNISDLANYLSNIVKLSPMLIELNISDCKINFEFSRQQDNGGFSIKKFFKNINGIFKEFLN